MRLWFLCSFLLLCACVNPSNIDQVDRATRSAYKSNRDVCKIQAPQIPLKTISGQYFLRALRKPESQDAFMIQLYIRADLINDWSFYNNAYSQGIRLDVTEIDRHVGACNFSTCLLNEDIAINLTMDELLKYSFSGLNATVSGKKGDFDIFVPAEYFTGFLRGMSRPCAHKIEK